MEENNKKKLNIVVFPWVAFGHIIPFLQLSKELAIKGHHIYFVSTPRNLQRLPNIPQKIAHLITLVPLPRPHIDNLPADAEATSDVGFEMGTDLLKKAFDGLQQPLANFLETCSKSSPLDWIIYDFACYWLPPIADKFGLRRVNFCIVFARTLAVLGPGDDDQGSGSWTDLCRPPHWIPFPDSSVYFLPYEARGFYHVSRQVTSSGVSDLFRFRSCVRGCDVLAVRSCMQLEGQLLQAIEKLYNKVVCPLGLLLPSLEEGERGDDDTWLVTSQWLGKQRNGSVVYVAFGSEFEPSQDQLTELALGLELSQLPFFWAFRRSQNSTLELPEGFEDRTRDRGMVWTSWVPQLRIMSHDAVGGFLTHCGWSSIIEALQFGKPLIMLPLAFDHGLYARFMTLKKVGVEIPRNEEDGSLTRNSVAESLKMVLQDDAGQNFKDEAQKLSSIFADKRLQGHYIDKFIDNLCDQ